MKDVGGVAAEVLVGSAILRIAPEGTDLPTLDGTDLVWDAAWTKVGYTEDGVEQGYQPTFKDIMVDEEMSPVDTILTEEKGSISAKLAQATLKNMQYAISASTLDVTHKDASATKRGYEILYVGSGSPVKVMVALEGTSEKGLNRVIVGYRAIAIANVQMTYKKTDKLLVPVEFRLLADSTKPLGQRLFQVYNEIAEKTA